MLTILNQTEDRNFREGETVYDVDGNAYTVRGPCVVLNVNDSIVYNLNEGEMRNCFTRQRPTESIERQTEKQLAESGHRTITLRDKGHKVSWSRFAKGHGKLTMSSHHKTKYLAIEVEEISLENPDRPFTKTAMVSFSEAGGRAVYEMLKEIYGGDA